MQAGEDIPLRLKSWFWFSMSRHAYAVKACKSGWRIVLKERGSRLYDFKQQQQQQQQQHLLVKKRT
eukprot:1160581-Pelagomonas_calceolata.AAC.10